MDMDMDGRSTEIELLSEIIHVHPVKQGCSLT
jgi:hypothetical protein